MQNEYKTKDLYEAAALKTSACPYFGCEKLGRTFWFIFENNPFTQKTAGFYWNYKLSLDAKTLADTIRNLKEIIFSQNQKFENM